MKKTLPIFLALLFSCKQAVDKIDYTFIVPSDSMLTPKRTGNQPPPPPAIKEYYFPFNFIIDTGEHVYFYQQQIRYGWICGTGMDENPPPRFIDLQPEDIHEVPRESLEDFIKANIKYVDEPNRQFALASVTDTITSYALWKIFSVCKDKKNKIVLTFRQSTQEEDVVLKFKKNKQKYSADEIKWDSTKTLFPPKMERINFMPPKVVD